eukprot:Partr_v1_DN27474_c0_g1_i3_m72284
MDEEMLNALEIRDDTPAEWTDITSEVQALASSLAIGELLHTPDFSLFHALAAVEIMDPKMDSGMLSGGDPVKYRDISTVLSRDDLDTSQLQAIGIQYLRCLVCFHSCLRSVSSLCKGYLAFWQDFGSDSLHVSVHA